MEDRRKASSAIDNMEEASVVEHGKSSMYSSSSPSNEPPRYPIIEGYYGCGGICQAVHLKRRRAPHTDVLDDDDDDIDMAVRGDDAAISIDTFVDGPFERKGGDDSGGTVSPSGVVADIAPSKGRVLTKQRRRNYRRSFRSGGASAAIVVVLPFLLVRAIASTAATSTEVAGEGIGTPALDGRFQRRHVTTSARANLRRPSSSSTTTSTTEISSSDENADGRRMANFFADSRETDRKPEPLEFRIENVNRLRPHQGEAPPEVAEKTQNLLPPYSPAVEQRATIVFHPPVNSAAASTKATLISSIPQKGASSSNYFSSQPAQTILSLQKQPQPQPQPHGGSHWHAAANFGPQIQFTSASGMIPAAELTFHSPSTASSTPPRNTYQDAQEDYQNFYKQTQEEKDETVKAREGLLAKLYGSSLEKPNHSDDIGASFGVEGPVINRGPSTAQQSRANDYSFTLEGNTIAVVVPGEADPIPTDFTVDPSNNYCVNESDCKVFYDIFTNDFVDGNGVAVGVDIDIDTIISQSGSGSSGSSNSNLGYTLFLDGNTIVVRYQGQDYATQFTVDSNKCVVQSNNCEYFWDGNGGFVNAAGQAVTVEIDLETIITSSGTGTTGGGSTTTTTETTVTEETTTETNESGGGNNNNRDDDDDDDEEEEASGPTMEPAVESDSADEDSAEHSGKGYSSSSSSGKGKGSKSSKGSKGCKSGKSGKASKASKSSKSCSSSGKGKGKGGSSPSSPSGPHPPPPSPPSSPSKPSPSRPTRPTRPPVSRPTKQSRPTRAPRPSQTPKPTRRPRTRPTPRPTQEGPTISPRPTITEEPTPAPAIRTPKPTFGPTEERCNGITDATRAILIRYEIIPISGLVALTDTESPQWQAYEWLVYDDDRFVCPNDDTLVQRYILAVLYFATAGNAWDRCYRDDNECREEEDAESYLSASSECEWYGSECFADGLIESVTLENNNLMNEMPLEITQIARLLDLNLSNNDLEGTLPRILGDLVDLRTFNVEKNTIEGRLPESMFELQRLEVLNLNGNDFTGTINVKVGDLRRLKEAHFGDNGFEGEIPGSLGRLSDLKLLRLQDNDLEGEMPAEVCELRDEKLDELWSDCGTPPDPPQVECELDVCCTECFAGRR